MGKHQLFACFQALAYLATAREQHPVEFARLDTQGEELVTFYHKDDTAREEAYRKIRKKCNAFLQYEQNIKSNTRPEFLTEAILKLIARCTVEHEFLTDLEVEGHRMRACGCFEKSVSPDSHVSKTDYSLFTGQELLHMFSDRLYTSDCVEEAEKEFVELFRQIDKESDGLARFYLKHPWRLFFDQIILAHHCKEYLRTDLKAAQVVPHFYRREVSRKLVAEYKTRHRVITEYHSFSEKSGARKQQWRACGCKEPAESEAAVVAREDLFGQYHCSNIGGFWMGRGEPLEFSDNQTNDLKLVQQKARDLYTIYLENQHHFRKDLKYLQMHCKEFRDSFGYIYLETRQMKSWGKYRLMKIVAEYMVRHEFHFQVPSLFVGDHGKIITRTGCGCWPKEPT